MPVKIPQAGGVPGIGGPPNWLTAPPAVNNDLDDVRWNGAVKTSFGAGGSGSNSVRATQSFESGQQYIYLSFRAAFVQSLSDQNDLVYVGLRRTGGAKAMVIRLQAHGPTFTPAGPPSANPPAALPTPQVSTRATADAAWAAQPSAPAWIATNGRGWLQSAASAPAGDPNNRWAIQLRIPAAAVGNIDDGTGPNLGTDFEMWYVMLGSLSNGAVTILGEYRRPGAGGSTTVAALTTGNYPNPFGATNPWDQFQLAAGPADFGGVAIYGNGYIDVRVRNVAYGEGTTIDNGQQNVFIARPRNYRPTGATINAGDINATFRIANWGTVPGNPWQTDFSSGSWDYVPGNSATTPVSSALSIPTIAANTNPPLTEPIALTVPNMTLAAGKSIHQCIYVTLAGTNIHFLNDSTYVNMNFDSASVLEREAEVSVVGLDPFSPQPRDVYLAVEKLNMPSKTAPGTNEGMFLQQTMGTLIEQGGALGEKLQAAQRQLGRGEEMRRDRTQKQRLDALVSVLSEVGLTQGELDKLFPTIRIHGYHDTGERVPGPGGTLVPVVRAQSSFGLYAYHEGGLDGWQTSLQGAQRIDDNLYVIKVPNNGTAKVKVKVQGVSPGEERIPEDPMQPAPGPDQLGCLAAVVQAIRKLLGQS